MPGSSLRVGLVGAGGISASHLPHLLALGADVWAYSEHGAAELVARYGGSVAASLTELLDRVDVVDIITPTPTHLALARTALEAGKDVILEKPLTRTREEAEELVAVVAATGRRLYPAHVVRYFPEYVQLKAAVEGGLLGELAVLRFARSGAFPTRSPWFGDRELSGGIILDQMIHDLDMARWVAGEVVRVSAVASGAGEGDQRAEAAHVLLSHASGAISHVAGVWGPAHQEFTTEYSVTGAAGSLEHSSRAERGYVTDLAAGAGVGGLLPETDPAEDPYFLELREFLHAFAGGPPPRVDCADGAAAVGLATAALESLTTGQPVHLAPTGA